MYKEGFNLLRRLVSAKVFMTAINVNNFWKQTHRALSVRASDVFSALLPFHAMNPEVCKEGCKCDPRPEDSN